MDMLTLENVFIYWFPLALPQVTFRPDLSTAEVHDESIKGPLKVGVGGWSMALLFTMSG